MERMTGIEPVASTLARSRATSCATSAKVQDGSGQYRRQVLLQVVKDRHRCRWCSAITALSETRRTKKKARIRWESGPLVREVEGAVRLRVPPARMHRILITSHQLERREVLGRMWHESAIATRGGSAHPPAPARHGSDADRSGLAACHDGCLFASVKNGCPLRGVDVDCKETLL